MKVYQTVMILGLALFLTGIYWYVSLDRCHDKILISDCSPSGIFADLAIAMTLAGAACLPIGMSFKNPKTPVKIFEKDF